MGRGITSQFEMALEELGIEGDTLILTTGQGISRDVVRDIPLQKKTGQDKYHQLVLILF